MKNKQPHSANVLNDIRDYWYSPDFLELMAKRWKLNEVKTMLDVGCGMGHWGQLLAPFLSSDMHTTGIDPEKMWIEKAIERAEKKGLTSHTTYQTGTAETIPFPDGYFDMVTCQTVLIHVKDVSLALKEMLRVLKPGGLIAIAEPNNLVSRLILNNLNFNEPVDEIIDSVRFELICERGREKLNKGNASRGDIIPYYFYQADIKNIQVYLSDLADYFIPPYDSPREKITLSGLDEDFQEYWDSVKEEMQEFFLAGDGLLSDFEMHWDKVIKNKDRIIAGYKNKTLCAAGGLIMYLISGRKK
jgi:2-polyprenyl-3-methyl-5-hydroxy-6-metoxy-1,4-benzoquinol methylase